MTFRQLLDTYRLQAPSERAKGDRFEHLMQAYLRTDPQYAPKFKHVWLWNDFPGRHDLGGTDTGIDLVALTHEGDYWAIQCKFVREETALDKPALDSFLSTSSREFKDGQLRTTRFAQRLWISTSNKSWSANAEKAILNQQPPVARLRAGELAKAPVDWAALDAGISGTAARQVPDRALKPHQQAALAAAHTHFSGGGTRGKLIMACGTGKTFTALRIAENETKGHGCVLFLVPSIALLGQTLREWTTFAQEPINAICVCSDPDVSRAKIKDGADPDSFSTADLPLPASTNPKKVADQLRAFAAAPAAPERLTVVFSTYQSADIVSQALGLLRKESPAESAAAQFDLLICDEAHRTTGVTLADEDESAFTRVHDNGFLPAARRLYMTATPRIYGDIARSRAAEADAVLCSMDDAALFGPELYRIGFGEAVHQGLLTDYKVLVLTLSEQNVSPALQKAIAGEAQEIKLDDIAKLIGCANALSKKIIGDEGTVQAQDPEPMRRAVAFGRTIAESRVLADKFGAATTAYTEALPAPDRAGLVQVHARHIDGGMGAPQREGLVDWLKEAPADGECRVLTNVRCLSEGVDVPALDAVLFLSARRSQVDVVQSVGRVMRTSPGKKYGYVIIPVVVPVGMDPAEALDKNKTYDVVWEVLNALRAHDDRFGATINAIELNGSAQPSEKVIVGTLGHTYDPDSGTLTRAAEPSQPGYQKPGPQLGFDFGDLQRAVFARMVLKVGERTYWEQWAKEVAGIAEREVARIGHLVAASERYKTAFEGFLAGLHRNINPSITPAEAIEMLAQHVITRPVFEALFQDYGFAQQNPISQSMQRMLDLLEEQTAATDTEKLQHFYDSVRRKAEAITTAQARQQIVVELYDKFFKTAFPKLVEKLGIVYTPVEVVDFILRSVDDVLRREFGRGLTDENIHVLDPFTGTGTFVTRLLQTGLIRPADLARKYHHELHANELVLLAYYIAAVNIENAYHEAAAAPTYEPFAGICLTDTFQLGETAPTGQQSLVEEMFPQNSERVSRQRKAPLRVIIGNPPYSEGQKSANDNAQNLKYDRLDQRIGQTYAALTNATLKNSLYNSYFRAFRWASDQLASEGGIVAFVSNGKWIDSNSADGFRKSLEQEFSAIYVFNLRGDQRTSGELSRKEGGKIFGSGSRNTIAVTLLVKNPQATPGKARIQYHDIGDYLSREEKLTRIKQFGSIGSPAMVWRTLTPNDEGDWLSQRSNAFGEFIPLAPESKFDPQAKSFFSAYAIGVSSNRDAWVYGFSRERIKENMARTITFFNEQQRDFANAKRTTPQLNVDHFLSTDPQKISWTANLKKDVERQLTHQLTPPALVKSLYRPFAKQHLYFDRPFIERPGLASQFFPTPSTSNLVISVTGTGGSKDFSALISDQITGYDLLEKARCFPLYHYDERPKQNPTLFDNIAAAGGGGLNSENELVRRDGISDFIWERAKKQVGATVQKADIFYYVYGLLHSPAYRAAFAADLKKMLPRLPLLDAPRDFWAFSRAGRQLAELHIGYETVPPSPSVTVTGATPPPPADAPAVAAWYRVEKMRFPKKGQHDTILVNSRITVSHIPAAAYQYVVNGKSAIEWVMERYQVTTHKESHIRNDPNDWAAEAHNPRYILDLLLSVIEVSLRTQEIVAALPEISFS